MCFYDFFKKLLTIFIKFRIFSFISIKNLYYFKLLCRKLQMKIYVIASYAVIIR